MNYILVLSVKAGHHRSSADLPPSVQLVCRLSCLGSALRHSRLFRHQQPLMEKLIMEIPNQCVFCEERHELETLS